MGSPSPSTSEGFCWLWKKKTTVHWSIICLSRFAHFWEICSNEGHIRPGEDKTLGRHKSWQVREDGELLCNIVLEGLTKQEIVLKVNVQLCWPPKGRSFESAFFTYWQSALGCVFVNQEWHAGSVLPVLYPSQTWISWSTDRESSVTSGAVRRTRVGLRATIGLL